MRLSFIRRLQLFLGLSIHVVKDSGSLKYSLVRGRQTYLTISAPLDLEVLLNGAITQRNMIA